MSIADSDEDEDDAADGGDEDEEDGCNSFCVNSFCHDG
jgi:hypothetical protein